MGLHRKGTQQAKEASDTFERFGNIARQAQCFIDLALLMHDGKQLDAVEEIALHAIDLRVLSVKDQKYRAYQGHRVLSNIHHSEGERGNLVHHLEAAREIASSQPDQ